jgi:alanyl-tRNA synthetase
MNQLKDVFLEKCSFDEKYSMLTNSQLCVRTGGKHNDFDDVGKDSYHLTSFEMLGTWSLNAYGKEQAIKLAYDF